MNEQPPLPPEPELSEHALKIKILSLQVDIVLAAAEKRRAEIERDDWRRIAEQALDKLKKLENA